MGDAHPRRFLPWLKQTLAGSAQGVFDISVSMVSQGVGIVAGLGSSILLARGLGPEAMGNYALILSLSTLTATLSDLGIGQTAIRFASRAAAQNREDALFSVLRWAFRLRVVLVLTISLAAFLVAVPVSRGLWHAEQLSSLVRVSLLTGIFMAIASVPGIYYQSVRRFQMNAAVSIAQSLISFTGVLAIFLLRSWALEWVVGLGVLAAGASALALCILVPKRVFFQAGEMRGAPGKVLRKMFVAPEYKQSGTNTFAFYMMISSIAVALTLRADVWLMGVFVPKEAIGQYSVANRFTIPLTVLLGALNTILWPRASALTDRAEVIGLLRKTIRISALCCVLCLAYSIFAPLVSPFLFGQKYRGTVLLGQLLCIRCSIAILVSPIGIIGYNFGLVRQYWIVNIVQFCVVCAINIVLLPRIGVMGSVIALIVNEIISFTYTLLAIMKKAGEHGAMAS